jgi:hypothetical protein
MLIIMKILFKQKVQTIMRGIQIAMHDRCMQIMKEHVVLVGLERKTKKMTGNVITHEYKSKPIL